MTDDMKILGTRITWNFYGFI